MASSLSQAPCSRMVSPHLFKSLALPQSSPQGPTPDSTETGGLGVPGTLPALKAVHLCLCHSLCFHSAHYNCVSHSFPTPVSVFLPLFCPPCLSS